MADGFIHTVHKDGQWVNEIEGGAEFGGYALDEATGGCCRSGPGDAEQDRACDSRRGRHDR